MAAQIDTTKTSLQLHINYRSIDSLSMQPRNPRLHSKAQVRQIAKSIKAFGFNCPILIDSASQVVAGHGRLLACRELGMAKVPTIELGHLSAEQARAFLIAENRLTLNSTWDESLLAIHFQELSALSLDFNLEDTGFSTTEILP